ncbi:glycosyltransferase [Candidatus Micrarchaeota archaeon]|nr:glycosyltransferase [Candidatus Micrarchaeota archaeon]MBU1886690.1 glycosyltransferase [Candidatus Micrarchaeota archaeon]
MCAQACISIPETVARDKSQDPKRSQRLRPMVDPPQRLKIAMVTETYLPIKNGVDVLLLDLLPTLSQHADITLFAPGLEGNKIQIEHINDHLKICRVPTVPLPIYAGYNMPIISSRRLRKLLEQEQPDIVHLHAPVLMGIQALRISKALSLPTVATYHTHLPEYTGHIMKGTLHKFVTRVAKSIVEKLIKYVFSQVDMVITPTNIIKKLLEDYGVMAPVTHVPCGMDLNKYEYAGKEQGVKFRQEHNIPLEKPLVLYVGRISFEKKLEHLLNAFVGISEATLVIVGDGPSLNEYKKLAKTLGITDRVMFTGAIDHKSLGPVYHSADIFVSPSDTETFGLTFTEAMMCGIPPIGVDRLGPSEIIISGHNGYLVAPNNPEALATKIRVLLHNPEIRRELGTQAKSDVRQYNTNNIAHKHMEVYHRVLERYNYGAW